MAIYPGDVSNEAVKAVSNALEHRAATSAFLPSRLRNSNANALAIAMPHRVAYLPFDKIDRDAKLREVAQIGPWRFLVQEKQPHEKSENIVEVERYISIASATAVQTETGEYEFGELNEGPFVAETEDAIRSAEKLAVVKAGHFEALFLGVPAVYVGALWLWDRHGETDFFIPMPSPLQSEVFEEPMKETQFLKFLRNLAGEDPLYLRAG
jgi:hypothetical protein